MSHDTSEIRELLEARLEALRERLGEMNETLRQRDGDDFEDLAADIDDDDVLESQTRAGSTEAQYIEAALKRIDDDTYGKCVACGKPIEKRRLRAIPEAANCFECASRTTGR